MPWHIMHRILELADGNDVLVCQVHCVCSNCPKFQVWEILSPHFFNMDLQEERVVFGVDLGTTFS